VIDGAEIGIAGSLFQAGTFVPAGTYRRVDAPGCDVVLERPDRLPASFDGKIALYLPMPALASTR